MSKKETADAFAVRRYGRYPAYKDSGVEWLGEIPEHWEVMKVTWLFSIGSGTTPPSDDPVFYGGETPWITTSELRESVVLSTEKSVTQQALKEYSSLKVYPSGSLAVAMYGATIGRLGILGVPATVNQACCVFSTPRNIEMLFWFYWLQMRRNYLISLGYGGGQPNLSQELLKSVRLPTPPLSEQRAIVCFLGREAAKIDALLGKNERLIDLLEEKRAALITQAVTKGLDSSVRTRSSGIEWVGEIPGHWETKKIKRLCLVRRGASPRLIEDPAFFDNDGNYGGLFISIAGTIGKPVITKIGCCIHYDFVYFVGLTQNREFLYYLFASGEPYKGLGKLGTQLDLNTDTIGDIHIPVPPPKEQEDIVAFLDHETAKLDSLITKVREAIARLKELRAALISAAVTGKIDVREEVS